MVAGVLAVEEPSEKMVTVFSEAHSEDVRGQGGTGRSSMGEYVFPPEREGGVLVDRACGGGLEGLCGSDELFDKSDCDPTRCVAWVQGGEGYGESDLGGKFVASVSRDFT